VAARRKCEESVVAMAFAAIMSLKSNSGPQLRDK
jgi:hypothetical protein